jgi:hypothetical protein
MDNLSIGKNVKIYEDNVTSEKHMPEVTKPEGPSP